MAAEDTDTERMDRGDLGEILPALPGRAAHSLLRLEIRLGAGHHLAGGFVGERHGEDPRRPRSAPHQMGHPGDDDARLSRAGPGKHQKRPDRRLNSLRLRRIEPAESARRRVPRPGHGGGGPGKGAQCRGPVVNLLLWQFLRRTQRRCGVRAEDAVVGLGGRGVGNVRRESVHVEKRPCGGMSGSARQSAGPDRTTAPRGHRPRSA